MPTAAGLATFALLFAGAALVPGPGQAALLGQVLHHGRRQAIGFGLGMIAGNQLWLWLAAAGLAAIAARHGPLFAAIRWLGIAYLLYLALRLWRATPGRAGTQPQSGALTPWLGGLGVALANPKALAFFGAILPQAFDMNSLHLQGVVTIAVLGLTIDLAVQWLYLAGAERIGRSLQKPRRLTWLNRGTSLLLAGAAVLLALRR
ncbi:MAG: LysE family transporter [Steroidobacteraceae bacterium]